MSDKRLLTLVVEGERAALRHVAAMLDEELAPGVRLVAFQVGSLIDLMAVADAALKAKGSRHG